MTENGEEADRIAAMVRASRADFARLFEAVAARHKPDRPRQLHVLVQSARRLGVGSDTDPNSDVFAFRVAYRLAASEGWLDALTKESLLAGLLVAGPGAAAPMEAAGLAKPPGMTFEPQAAVNPADGFPDPLTVIREFSLAMRRVCRIVVSSRSGRDTLGTGFLVGPQTVLTNWHVVRDLLRKPDGSFDPDDVKASLRVQFDRVLGTGPAGGAGQAQTFRATAIEESNEAYEDEYDGSHISATASAPRSKECLDFALIRLKDAPGVARGSYRISPERWPIQNTTVFVIQFPGQFAMRITMGRFEEVWDRENPRIRHSANTEAGSSGGLCLAYDKMSEGLRPVALHQGSIRRTTTGEVINQAIPLARIEPKIAKTMRRLDAIAPIPKLGDVCGSEHIGKPVFGRGELQRYIAEAAEGQARFVVVRPQAAPGATTRKIGKSFAERILRSMLPDLDHTYITLSARDVPSDARALAQLILDRIEDSSTARADLPHMDDADTTMHAWIADQLLGTAFGPRLQAAARNRLVWLVIDDLDVFELPDAGGRALLDELYLRINQMPALRVVLIGLTRELPSIEPQLVRIERITSPPGVVDLAGWLERRFGAGRAVEKEIVESIAKIACSFAGNGEDRGPALAAAVVRHIDPSLPPEVPEVDDGARA